MIGPTDIDNWEHFFKAFEDVFHHDWAATRDRIGAMQGGTFYQPEPPEIIDGWANRQELFEWYNKVRPPLDLVALQVQEYRKQTSKYETWVEGEVLLGEEGLQLRVGKPVTGNTTADVVTLGIKRGTQNIFLPALMNAGQIRQRLRLYGLFVPSEHFVPGYKPSPSTPSVTFVPWRLRLPGEPDEIPESEKLQVTPDDQVEGYKIQLARDPASLTVLEAVMREFDFHQHHPRSCVIIMHGFIELLINTLIEEKCKTGKKMTENNRDYPHSVKLAMLFETGVLTEQEFKELNWFRRLRNDAAHGAVFIVSPEKLQLFAGTDFDDVSQFPRLCMTLFANVWNRFHELFAPKFAPKGYQGPIEVGVGPGKVIKMSPPQSS